jgi:hypothetical protein
MLPRFPLQVIANRFIFSPKAPPNVDINLPMESCRFAARTRQSRDERAPAVVRHLQDKAPLFRAGLAAIVNVSALLPAVEPRLGAAPLLILPLAQGCDTMPFHLSQPFLLRADQVIDYYAFAALQESAFGTQETVSSAARGSAF